MKRSISAPVVSSSINAFLSNGTASASTTSACEEVAPKKQKLDFSEQKSSKVINTPRLGIGKEVIDAKSDNSISEKQGSDDLGLDKSMDFDEFSTPAFIHKTKSPKQQRHNNLRQSILPPKACAREKRRSLTQCVKLITKKCHSPNNKSNGQSKTIPEKPNTASQSRKKLNNSSPSAQSRKLSDQRKIQTKGSPNQRFSPCVGAFKVYEDNPIQVSSNANSHGNPLGKTSTPSSEQGRTADICQKPGIRDVTNQVVNTSRMPFTNAVLSKFKVPTPPGNRNCNAFKSPCQNICISKPNSNNNAKTPSPTSEICKFKMPSPPSTVPSNATFKTPSPQGSIIPFTKPMSMCNTSKFITPINQAKLVHSSTLMKRTPPMCECGRRSNRKVVQTPGPNVGRVFFACPLGRKGAGKKSGCGFFKWEEQIQRTGMSPNLQNRGLTSCSNNSTVNCVNPVLGSNARKEFGNFTPLCSGFGNGIGSKALVGGYKTPLPQPNFQTPNSEKSGIVSSKKQLGLGMVCVRIPPL